MIKILSFLILGQFYGQPGVGGGTGGGSFTGNIEMGGNTISDAGNILVIGSSTRCTTTNGLGVGAVIFCGAVEIDGVLYADAGVVSTKYETTQLRMQGSTISNIGAGTNINLTPAVSGQVVMSGGLVMTDGNINLTDGHGIATDVTAGTYPFLQLWNSTTSTFTNAILGTSGATPTLQQMSTTFNGSTTVSGNSIVNGTLSVGLGTAASRGIRVAHNDTSIVAGVNITQSGTGDALLNFGLPTDSKGFAVGVRNTNDTFRIASTTSSANANLDPTSSNVLMTMTTAGDTTFTSSVAANAVNAPVVQTNNIAGRQSGNITIAPSSTEASVILQSTITGNAHAPIAVFKQTDVGDAYFTFEWGNVVTSPQNRGHFGYNSSTDLIHWTVGASVIGGNGKDVFTIEPTTQVLDIKKDLMVRENIVMQNLKTVDGVDVSALATRVTSLENPPRFAFDLVQLQDNKVMSTGETGGDVNIVMQPAEGGSVVLAGSTVAQGHISFAPPHGIATGTSADPGTYNIIQTWDDNSSTFVPAMTLNVAESQGPSGDLASFVTHDGRAIAHLDEVPADQDSRIDVLESFQSGVTSVEQHSPATITYQSDVALKLKSGASNLLALQGYDNGTLANVFVVRNKNPKAQLEIESDRLLIDVAGSSGTINTAAFQPVSAFVKAPTTTPTVSTLAFFDNGDNSRLKSAPVLVGSGDGSLSFSQDSYLRTSSTGLLALQSHDDGVASNVAIIRAGTPKATFEIERDRLLIDNVTLGDVYTHDASEFQSASANLTTLASSEAYFLTLSDDANAAEARTTLGLGGAATSDLIGDTKYIVAASGAPYSTIQSAIDACVATTPTFDAPCVIKILPGSYTENITLYAQVTLEGASDGVVSSINGTVTANYGNNSSGPFNVSSSLKNLRINSPANGYGIDFTGTTAQSLWLKGVRIYKGTTGKGMRVNNTGASTVGSFTSIVYMDDVYIQGAGTNATACVEHSAGRINGRGNINLENPTLATTWVSTGSAVSWQTGGTIFSSGKMTFASSGTNTITSAALTVLSTDRCVNNTGSGTLVLGQFGCSAISSNAGAMIDASAGVVVWSRGSTAGLNFASVVTGAFGVLAGDNLSAYFQFLDSDLTSIAALSTTSFGRSLLTQADAAAARATLGVSASSGDVTGPSSSTDNTVAVFNSTTGKIIKEATGITATGGTLTATTLAGTISTATQNSITTLKGVTQVGPDTFGLFYNGTFGVWGVGTTPSFTFSLRTKSLGVTDTITAGNTSGYSGAAISIGNPNANSDRHIQYGSAWSVGLDGSTADDFVFSAGTSLGSSNRLTLTTGGNLTATGTITGGSLTATGSVNSNYFTSALNSGTTTSGLYIAQANASGDVSLALTSTPNTSSWAIGTRGDQANGTLYFTQSASSVPATARDTSKFSLTTAGNATFAGTISATRFNGYQLAASAGTQIITIASNKNFTLNNTLTISGADSKTLTVSDNAQVNQDTRTTASPTFTGVTLSDGGTKPTCDATNVGRFFRAAGTTDTIEACAQVSAGTYSWRNLIASGGGGGDASTSISSSTDTAIAVFDGTTGKLLKQNAATKLSGSSLSFEGTQSSLVFYDTTSSAHDFTLRNDNDAISLLADAGSDGTFELTPFSVTSAGVATVASSVVVPTITPPSGNLTLDPNAGIVIVDKTFAGHSPAISIRNDELAGDASIRFANTAATQSWSVGMDGSDNGYFKIGYTASATNNIGTGTMLYIDTSGVAYFTGQVVTPAVSADATTLDNNTLTSTTTLQIASGASSNLTLAAQGANRLLVGSRIVSVQANTIFNAFYSATTGASALAITGNVMSLSCSSATTISTLESALYNIVLGTVVVLRFEGPNCTIANTDSGVNNTIDLAGSSNFTGTANDTLTLVRVGGAANIWVETSRSVN